MSKDQARVMKHIAMDAQTGCWLWLGTVRSIKQPYGRMIIGSRTDGTRRSIGAHQFSYMAFVGAVPPGQCVCHTCDNPRCVNPYHLFLGSKKDNAVDMTRKGRSTGKLTTEQVVEIRASTKGSKTLAKIYGVDDSHIRALRRGRYYEFALPPPPEKENT